jgi:hypothetical protein|tara:strand:- start:21720 stop:26366 length:4647 start_codon:yes stop_codon:yes gene_type:complete
MVNPYVQQQLQGAVNAPINPFAPRGQTDLLLLQQLSQGFAPIMTAPQPSMRTGFENLPGFNQPGIMGLAMNQFVAPMLQQMMGKHGMLPGGLSPQNMVDYQASQQFQNDQRRIMESMAGRDEAGYYQTMRGMQALTGGPFNAPQRAAARQLASTAAGMTSTLAPLAPELIDSLSGRTGSAAVMAMRMQQFNRFRTDPVTGLMGFSQESNINAAEQVFDDMFKSDNMAQMRGMKAGQVGQMYGEMVRRGMIGGDARPFRERIQDAAEGILGGGDRDSIAEVRGLNLPKKADGDIDFANLDSDQMDKLRGLEGVQGELRKFSGEKVKTSLQGYVDAVTTMREIFGDAGNTNAPMSQLIQGLEALSQGSMTQIDPTSLNMMVRTTQQLAKESGMSIDAAITMQQQGAATLQGLGMERVFAPSITQGTMAFGQAAIEQGAGANPAWGLENMDFQRQLDQNLRAQATASPVTNALSALVRAEGQLGGFGNDERGRQTTSLAEAVKSGRTEYTYTDDDGNEVTRGVFQDSNLIQDMLIRQGRESGLDEDAAAGRAQRILMQRGANREFALEHNINNLTRRMQPGEIRDELVMPRAEGVLRDYIDDRDVARQAATEFAEAFTGMDRETATDRGARNAAFANTLRGKVLQDAGETDAEYESRLQMIAEESFSEIDEAVRDPRGPWAAYRSAQNLMVQQNETTLRDTGIRERRAKINAGIRDSLTGLTGGGILGNLVGAVQDAGEDETQATLVDILGKTFGGVRAEEVAERLEAPMGELRATRANIESLQTRVGLAKDSDEKDRLLGELEEEQVSLKSQTTKLRNLAESEGLLDQEDALDIGDIEAFRAADETRRQNQLTASSFLLRPFAGEDLDDRLARGARTGLLGKHEGPDGEQIGMDPRDTDELLTTIATAVAGDDKDADIDEIKRKLQRGEQKLTPEQQEMVLNARRDAIRIAPTVAEVDTALEEAKIPEAMRKNEEVRRLFAGSLATQSRMEKTGVTRADLRKSEGEVTDADLDGKLKDAGVGEDVLGGMTLEGKRELLDSQQESAARRKMAERAVTGDAENAEQVRAAYESFSKDNRDTTRRAAKSTFDAAQTIIEETGSARFVRTHGGRGLLIRDELEDIQEEEVKLRRAVGGDIGALELSAFDYSLSGQRRLSDHFLAEQNADTGRFFEDGPDPESRALKAEFGMGDKTQADFEGDTPQARMLRAKLGARNIQMRKEDLDKRRRQLVNELTPGIGEKEGRFTVTADKETATKAEGLGMTGEELQSLRSAARLKGVTIDDTRLRDLQKSGGAAATDEEKEVLGLAEDTRQLAKLSPTQFEAVRAMSVDQIGEDEYLAEEHGGLTRDEFVTARGRFEGVKAARGEALGRLEAADMSDPTKAMESIGAAMGLKGDDLTKFRNQRGVSAKMSTGEGQAWSREITSSIEQIKDAAGGAEGADTALFKDIQAALAGDAEAYARVSERPDGADLMGAGKILGKQGAGMLGILSDGASGENLANQLTRVLEKLQESKKEVEDVKERTMRLSGILTVKGNKGALNATGATGGNPTGP